MRRAASQFLQAIAGVGHGLIAYKCSVDGVGLCGHGMALGAPPSVLLVLGIWLFLLVGRVTCVYSIACGL